jgi:hypothetical protein
MSSESHSLELEGGKSPKRKSRSPTKKSPSGKSAYTQTLMAWRKKLSKKEYPSITDVASYVKKNKLYKAASPRRKARSLAGGGRFRDFEKRHKEEYGETSYDVYRREELQRCENQIEPEDAYIARNERYYSEVNGYA